MAMREMPGTEFEEDVDLLLLAMGFLGPERDGLIEQLGVALTERGNVKADESKMTSVPRRLHGGRYDPRSVPHRLGHRRRPRRRPRHRPVPHGLTAVPVNRARFVSHPLR